jgi:hypothetical protein
MDLRKRQKRAMLLVAAFACLLGLSWAPDAGSHSDVCTVVEPNNLVPTALELKAQRVADYMTAQGYEVLRGFFFLVGPEQCRCAIERWGNCYGNNPATPYIFPVLPAWPDQFIDEASANTFGTMPDGYSTSFRLDRREAIIILGLLPPPGRYFGIQTYLMSREGVINKNDPIYKVLSALDDPVLLKQFFDYSPNPRRLRLFASIGNSINNVVIQRQSGRSFGTQRFFVITPDRAAERAVREAIVSTGAGKSKEIFVEPVSSPYQAGLDESADDFLTMLRYALPFNEKAGTLWRKNLPLVVLRVRDGNRSRAPEPYPPVTLEKRTAFSENPLREPLQQLVTAAKMSWGQPGAPVQPMNDIQVMLDLVGPHCAARGMNCLGDTQDTTYQGTFNLFLDHNEVYAIAGTLGTGTMNATYTNIAVYRSATLSAFLNVSDLSLQGSAADYGNSVRSADKLYLQYIARDCGRYGLSAPACLSVTEDAVPRGEPMRIVQRSYLRPGTGRGPDSSKLLTPLIITFDGTAVRAAIGRAAQDPGLRR